MIRLYQRIPEVKFQFTEEEKQQMDTIYCKKGHVIYEEGSTPLGAYYIEKGVVKVSKASASGKSTIVNIALDDEVVNYMDIFSKTNYTTSATALEDSELRFIPKEKFWPMIRESQMRCDEILQKLAMDKKILETRIVDLAYMPVRGRLAGALMRLDDQFNDDTGYHGLHITRSDLACLTGTARESINRLLAEFKRDKLVSTSHNEKITILDPKGLTEVSEMYD